MLLALLLSAVMLPETKELKFDLGVHPEETVVWDLTDGFDGSITVEHYYDLDHQLTFRAGGIFTDWNNETCKDSESGDTFVLKAGQSCKFTYYTDKEVVTVVLRLSLEKRKNDINRSVVLRIHLKREEDRSIS